MASTGVANPEVHAEDQITSLNQLITYSCQRWQLRTGCL